MKNKLNRVDGFYTYMKAKKALKWFNGLSPFQHGIILVLLPFAVFTFLLVLLVYSVVPSGYVAVAGFVSYAVLIPCVFIYILYIRLSDEE